MCASFARGWQATSSSPATTAGMRHGRRGTSRSTSGPPPWAVPKTVQDVTEVIGYARECGLQVAPQGTGHSAGALGSLERHDPAQAARAPRGHDRPRGEDRARRGGNDLDRGRRGGRGARPRRARRLVAGRRRRRLHARRRPVVARPQVRHRRESRHGDRGRDRRRRVPASRPRERPRPLLGAARRRRRVRRRDRDRARPVPDRAGVRRRPLLPGRAGRARCCARGAPGPTSCPTS